jgi:hypothetical protein
VIGYKNNFRTIHSRCIFRIFGVYTIYTYIKWQLFYMLSTKQAIHNRLSDKTGLQVIGYKNNFRTIHSRCIFRIFGVYTIYTYIKWQLFYMLSTKQAIHNRLSDKTGGINHKARIKLLTWDDKKTGQVSPHIPSSKKSSRSNKACTCPISTN